MLVGLAVHVYIQRFNHSSIINVIYFLSLVSLYVKASDGGIPPLTANLSIHIRVTDVNDEPPEFISQTEYRKSFTDQVPSGTKVNIFEVDFLVKG